MRRILAWCTAAAAVVVLPAGPVRAAPETCGDGAPTYAFTGSFDTSLEGGYVLVPFGVPLGTTRVRVRLCHDRADIPSASMIKHTLDLGVYHALGPDGLYDEDEFRGWGGSSRLDVTITPERATPGFEPTPDGIPVGEWAAEIGVAAVVGIEEGDRDGSVAWRLEVLLGSDPEDADLPWKPTPYDTTAAMAEPGCYKGDFHVHAEHSGSAPMEQTFAYAFAPRPAGAGLDFIALSDYVTDRHWAEIGRFQSRYPGKLILRSAEIITYRGHVNNHASATYVDYRTGPVWELRDGTLRLVRAAQPASRLFGDIHSAGGFTQVNHPTTFPAAVPGFGNICRGCSWEYSDAETDWRTVDAMEVQTGPAGYTDPKGNEPGPNPFTPLAIEWWDRLRRAGHDITAVGSSDSHRADQEALTYSPIGEATTVVCTNELSEKGIQRGIEAGHAYVKFFSSDGPDLGFEARPLGGGPTATMGDEVRSESAEFTARVTGAAPSPQPRVLVVLRDGAPLLAVPVPGEGFEFRFTAAVSGDYRLQLQRGSAIEALANPITLVVPPLLPY